MERQHKTYLQGWKYMSLLSVCGLYSTVSDKVSTNDLEGYCYAVHSGPQ